MKSVLLTLSALLLESRILQIESFTMFMQLYIKYMHPLLHRNPANWTLFALLTAHTAQVRGSLSVNVQMGCLYWVRAVWIPDVKME